MVYKVYQYRDIQTSDFQPDGRLTGASPFACSSRTCTLGSHLYCIPLTPVSSSKHGPTPQVKSPVDVICQVFPERLNHTTYSREKGLIQVDGGDKEVRRWLQGIEASWDLEGLLWYHQNPQKLLFTSAWFVIYRYSSRS